MFKTRLLSGIVLVIIAGFLLVTGGDVLLGALALISLIGMFELFRAVGVEKSPLGVIGYLAGIAYYAVIFATDKSDSMSMMFFIFYLCALMAVYVITFPKYTTEQVVTTFFGLFYVAIMLSYIYFTEQLNNYLVWLIFLASWGCDTCAYCVGMLIGKHKMVPKLSPKKSVEGAVGGVLGATLLGVIFGLIFESKLLFEAPVLSCAIVCAIGAVISQIGDLAASAIKRNHNVKDYGHLIPGHGGILDRFDSVIFVTPVIYYVSYFLINKGF